MTVAGPLVAWQTPDGPGVAEHLAGLTEQGEVIVYFWTTGASRWQAVNVSEKTGIRLVGPLTVWQTPVQGGVVEHLAGLNPDGEIVVLFFSSGHDWQAWNLSKPLGYPALLDRLTSWQVPDGTANIEHLAGHDRAGRVLLWFWPTGSIRTVHLHALQLADDNGARQVQITPGQVQQWAQQANRIYASAGVQFLFVPAAPGPDWTTIQSTLLNSLQAGTGRPTQQEQDQGNAVAHRHRDKATVLFRSGAPPGSTGQGYADISYDFVVMPGFDNTGVCGHQNISQLGHELGHYLGLAHTFKEKFPSVAAAAQALGAAGGDPVAAFDGDGLPDTLPDPLIIQGTNPEPYQCLLPAVTLNGQVLMLPRRNIMSYYDAPVHEITPEQAQKVYESLMIRTTRGLAVETP